jgi:hypothetical protein
MMRKLKRISETGSGPELPAIDFGRLRAHNGSQKDGFEELCVQLFRRDFRSRGECQRVEGAGGDQGVEAYIVCTDKSEIGLQCKYFKSLGKSQWRQINKSVQTAVEHHPSLREYRVAVPLDRNPAQLKSWSVWTAKWKKLTKDPARFVWLGKSELSGSLTEAANRDLLVYWFGATQFSGEWMDGVIHSSLCNLDRRYSPKQHVDTESGRLADVFVWSPTFTVQIKRMLLDVVEVWRQFVSSVSGKVAKGTFGAKLSALTSVTDALLRAEIPSVDGRSVTSLLADVDSALASWDKVHDELEQLDCEAKLAARQHPNTVASQDYEFLLHHSGTLGQRLRRWRSMLHRSTLADMRWLLILGAAGTGKSHLVASIVDHARKRGQPALLLLGEHFTSRDEPWSQALKVVGWNAGLECLLLTLNQAGALAKSPALICIDAINESDHRSLWQNHLNAFAAKTLKYPYVRLIVSCRSDFAEITLPTPLAEGRDNAWARIQHVGFGEEVFEAVANYFAGYRVKSSHFPPLIEEFRNPLFLRLFCEAFENQTLPEGPVTLERVMSARIGTLTTKLQQDIDCSADDVRAAIYAIAHLIRQNEGRAVDKEMGKAAVNEFSAEKKHSRSLYTHLRSSGILIEVIERVVDAVPTVKVRFAFERFSDYFIAEQLLSEIQTRTKLVAAWKSKGRLSWLLDRESYWRNRGLISALAILIPERYQIELADLIKVRGLKFQVLQEFLASLPWRSSKSFTKGSRKALEKSQKLGMPTYLQALLRVATIPGHPFNAEFLHRALFKMSLQTRERVWTIPVAELTADHASVPAMVVTWGMRVPPRLVSDDQALLVSRILCWFFSSNRRAFRKRATLAAIRMLEGRAAVAAQIVRDFDEVNDPYVLERVYSVACGVAMREPAGTGLRELSDVVYHRVFAAQAARPHVLLRDYAQAVLEVASHRGSLADGIAVERFRPPFKSDWPKIVSETQVRNIEKDAGWREIVDSVRTEGMGMYGDFGRYVMESRVHHFSNVRIQDVFPTDDKPRYFDGRVARRWVLQRAKALGWSPRVFGEYEGSLPWRGRHEEEDVKVERIGKKYQWVALHELLGYLSDHYHMRPRWHRRVPDPFEGAWQLGVRDFDPSSPFVDVGSGGSEPEADTAATAVKPTLVTDPYPDPFADPALCANRVEWVVAEPVNFKPLVHLRGLGDDASHEWVALDGFWMWNESEYQVHRLAAEGRLKMWMHVRSWLVKEADLPQFMKGVKKIHFWGHGCESVNLGEGWIGEYPWGRPFAETKSFCAEPDEWIKAIGIQHARTTCDWSTRDGFSVPSPQLCDLLSLRWSGHRAHFLGPEGQVAAFQTGKLDRSESNPCVVRLDVLRDGLRRARFSIVWAVLAERSCWDGSNFVGDVRAEFSSIYTLGREGICGGLTRHVLSEMHRS